MKYITVKKDITIGAGYNSIRIRKGKYESNSFRSTYPFFDLANAEYFDIVSYEPLKRGTKVTYEGQFYYIEFSGNVKTEKHNGEEYTVGGYTLYKSLTNPKSAKHGTIYENQFKICTEYYFINSEGDLCKAYDGQKPNADAFRKHVGNYFTTETECRSALKTLKLHFTNQK